MRVEVCRDFRALRDLQEPWDRLLMSCAWPNPFQSIEWLEMWWRHFGRGRLLHIVLFRDEGILTGAFPGYVERGLLPGSKVLRAIGDRYVSSEFLSCMATKGREQEVAEAFKTHLRDARLDMVLVKAALVEDPGSVLLRLTARRGCATFDCGEIYHYISIPATVQEYRATLSKRQRRNINHARNKLNKAGEVRFESVSAEVWEEHLVDKAVQLNNAVCSARGYEGGLYGSRREFFREASTTLIRAGKGRANVVFLDERPVAFLFSLCTDSSICLYKTGYDPRWERLSVGSVVFGLVIDDTIERGLKSLDFLRGGQAYKKSWGAHADRQVADLAVCSGTLKGRVLVHGLKAWSAFRSMKEALKRRLPQRAVDGIRAVKAMCSGGGAGRSC